MHTQLELSLKRKSNKTGFEPYHNFWHLYFYGIRIFPFDSISTHSPFHRINWLTYLLQYYIIIRYQTFFYMKNCSATYLYFYFKGKYLHMKASISFTDDSMTKWHNLTNIDILLHQFSRHPGCILGIIYGLFTSIQIQFIEKTMLGQKKLMTCF